MNCSGNCASMKGKVLGVVRILLWLFMIFMWVMKFGAPAEMVEMIWGAGAALGLDFLSITTWFWLAVIGELLAGILLLTGCNKLSKIGAILALIIMVFAVNAVGFNTNSIIVSIAALVILIMGPGAWTCCKMSCCTWGACSKNDTQMQQQQQQQ